MQRSTAHVITDLPIGRWIAAGTIVCVVLVTTSCGTSPSAVADVEARAAFSQGVAAEETGVLAEIRAATARYHDVENAITAGYVAEPTCVKIATAAMGIHYLNPSLVGLVPGSSPRTGTDATIDLLQPEMLVYEPQPSGQRRLVAVEYLVFAAAWDAVHTGPPTFLGVQYPIKTHGWAPHYELHVWLWRHNPDGLNAEFNPKVVCP